MSNAEMQRAVQRCSVAADPKAARPSASGLGGLGGWKSAWQPNKAGAAERASATACSGGQRAPASARPAEDPLEALRALSMMLNSSSGESHASKMRTEFVVHPFAVSAAGPEFDFKTGQRIGAEAPLSNVFPDAWQKQDSLKTRPSAQAKMGLTGSQNGQPDMEGFLTALRDVMSTRLAGLPMAAVPKQKPSAALQPEAATNPVEIPVVRRELQHVGSAKELQAIQRSCRVGTTFFDDPDFPPGTNQYVQGWCRPSEIQATDYQQLKPSSSSEWHLLRGKPRFQDVRQGILGNCWFISSLASLADVQEGRYVKALLPGQTKCSTEGVYLVRLVLGGRRRDILVDDRLPCVGGDGEYNSHVAYCTTMRRQLWASLVEKALAKACGSYEGLSGGEASEAMTILTGWPCKVTFTNKAGFDVEALWADLRAARQAGSPMTCTSNRDTAVLQDVKLESRHCYSLLDVLEVEPEKGGRAVRLLKVRDPSNERCWSGPWSDSSACWSSTMRNRLGHAAGNRDGVFFMPFDMYLRFFDHCTICRILGADWAEVQVDVRLPRHQPPDQGFLLRAEQGTAFSLSLAQPERRVRRGPFHVDPLEPLACIGLVILKVDSGCTASLSPGTATAHDVARMRHRPTVSCEGTLSAGGTYLIVPLSLHDGVHRDVVVTCRSHKPVTLEKMPLDPSSIQSAWAAYARHRCSGEGGPGITEVVQGDCRLLVTQGSGACVVALAENCGDRPLRATLALVASNMRYTRGVAASTDWLKPGSGQLVQVALPKDEAQVEWAAMPALKIFEARPGKASEQHTPQVKPVGVGILHMTFLMPKVEAAPALPAIDAAPPPMPLAREIVRPGALLRAASRADAGSSGLGAACRLSEPRCVLAL